MWNNQASKTSAHPNNAELAGAENSSLRNLTKAKIWLKPNFRRLVLDGASPNKVRIYRFLYDWLPSKPRAVLPRNALYFANAVTLYSHAATEWLNSPTSISHLTIDQFSSALRHVLDTCWGETSSDRLYFTGRHERSARGCELHVILGDVSPFKKLPSFKAFDAIKRQMSRGWPVPRPAYESKGVFVLTPSDITLEAGGGFVRSRWYDSSAKDRGFFAIFDDSDEANEWHSSLAPFLVFTDRPNTRMISSFSHHPQAQLAAKLAAKPKKSTKVDSSETISVETKDALTV